MPAFIRYPFFGFVVLALSACGSSGSSRLIEPATPAMDDEEETTVQETYSSVKYLIPNVSDARDKFRKQVYKDTDGKQYLLTEDNVDDMNLAGVKLPKGVTTAPAFADLKAVYKDEDDNEYLLTPANVAGENLTGVDLPDGVTTAPAFADLTKVLGGATALSATATPARLANTRNARVQSANQYLSTGAVLARTNASGTIVVERPGATCGDGLTGYANCKFEKDEFRAATTFTLGPSSTADNRVSFRSFKADREPVMFYRDVLLSQVRLSDAGDTNLPHVYRDTEGREYLLKNANVTGKNLTNVKLPDGVTEAPAFADLKAVYKDEDDNEYLLTPANVAGMNLDNVDLPDGVTEAPDFADLTKVREGNANAYQYVGYDGILGYSMFFVGVYRFFDDDEEIEHLRFENASLGRIYDDDIDAAGIQNPSVALTGHGAMVGVERDIDSLAHHPVQGDVEITYDPSVEADPDATPAVEAADAMIDIAITNVQRLADDGQAWYARDHRRSALNWEDVPLGVRIGADEMDHETQGGMNASKFDTAEPPANSLNAERRLIGSLYGTKKAPEVGGVFHHKDSAYEIIGAFGSKLAPLPEDDEE